MIKLLSRIVSRCIAFIGSALVYLYNYGVYEGYRNKYELHPSFRFNGNGILFYEDGRIISGENSYIGEYSFIQAASGFKVIIGKSCQISHFVSIYTASRKADADYSVSKDLKCGNVTIGDYCWIGIKSTILGPVSIGENCCIGANSVVSRDMPPHSIVVGVPAKVVKFKSYLTEEKKIDLSKQFKNVLSSELLQRYMK